MLPEGLFGSFCFIAVPEGPGRFPEGLPEGCFKMLIYLGPGRFGRFPEELPEGFRYIDSVSGSM